MMQASEDYLKGWLLGMRLNTAGEVTASDCAISPYYEANEGSEVTDYNPSPFSANRGIWTYDNDFNGSFLGWANRGAGEHSFTMPIGRTKFRITLPLEQLDDCWIKDPAGNYLFKGKNVE